jgi:AcrR family transcriptional regulator
VKRKEQAAETEVALKDAARRVFARQGYLNTKITDITAEAGRAAGSFYNHFAGKEELLKALLADMLAESDEAVLAPDSEHSEDFTDRAAVRWHIEGFWRFHTGHAVELTALRQAALVNAEFGAQVEAMVAEDTGHMSDHLDWITRAGRTLPGKPDLVLAMFSGLLDGFGYRWQLGDGTVNGRRVSDDEAIDTLTEFVYRALNGVP